MDAKEMMETAKAMLRWPRGLDAKEQLYMLDAEDYDDLPFDNAGQALGAAHCWVTAANAAVQRTEERHWSQAEHAGFRLAGTDAAKRAKQYLHTAMEMDATVGKDEAEYARRVNEMADQALMSCAPLPGDESMDSENATHADANLITMLDAVTGISRPSEPPPDAPKSVQREWDTIATRMTCAFGTPPRAADPGLLAKGMRQDLRDALNQVVNRAIAQHAGALKRHVHWGAYRHSWKVAWDAKTPPDVGQVHAEIHPCAGCDYDAEALLHLDPPPRDPLDADDTVERLRARSAETTGRNHPLWPEVDVLISYCHEGVIHHQSITEPFVEGFDRGVAARLMEDLRQQLRGEATKLCTRPQDRRELRALICDMEATIRAGLHDHDAVDVELMASALDTELNPGASIRLVQGLAGEDAHLARALERAMNHERVRPTYPQARQVIAAARAVGLYDHQLAELATAMRRTPQSLGVDPPLPERTTATKMAASAEIYGFDEEGLADAFAPNQGEEA